MLEFVIYFASFLLTVFGLAAFIRFSGRFASIDIPNERSSHERPTLRGGGIVIVAVCCVLYAAGSLVFNHPINWGYLAGAVIIASVSWADDHFDLPAVIRFTAHTVAAVVLIFHSGPLTGIDITGTGQVVSFTWFAPLVSVLWIIWMTNAFNFMDGIDGIAGAQGVVSGIGWILFGTMIGATPIHLFSGVVLFSCLGFLIFNWSPARIFMGDVGSAFLGFTLSAMPLIGRDRMAGMDPLYFLAAIGFLWLFVYDTLFTFFRRLIKGEKVWKAHRSHLYQNLTDRWGSHARVSLLYFGLGLAVAITIVAAAGSASAGSWWVVAALSGSALIVTVLGFRKSN
ncbi:MAG: glycosyltransferase family 4 protein [Chloracidobacterium sp.]|nr:glycosyltransferase family 4 protein [Chloracidobacterium sp.]